MIALFIMAGPSEVFTVVWGGGRSGAMMRLDTASTSELLYVGFNQDKGCFACGTDSGFRIFNCDPFKQTYRRDFANGGIGIVEKEGRVNPDEKEWGWFSPVAAPLHSPLALEEHFPAP